MPTVSVALYDGHRYAIPTGPDPAENLRNLAAAMYYAELVERAVTSGDVKAAALLRAFAVNLWDYDHVKVWSSTEPFIEPPPLDPDTRVVTGRPLEPPPAGPS